MNSSRELSAGAPAAAPRAEDPAGPLLDVRDLRVYFGPARRPVRAVDGVTFAIRHGETVGLVGESGCGKSTLGRAILKLERIRGGEVRFRGRDVTALRGAQLRRFRRAAQMVFQDPFGSLNPRLSVGQAIAEAVGARGGGGARGRWDRAAELFNAVGLDPAYLRRYPHEFSGGQRQRIGIARSLAVDPVLLIADEPVSALDVSVQVQILNLLKDIRDRRHLSYLFVAHDLAVVRYVSDRILVMYLGRIVESAPADALYRRPAHPYSEALLASVPDVDKGLARRRGGGRRAALSGDLPSAAARVTGCPFASRCPRVRDRCRSEAPPLREVAGDRWSACHFAEEVLGA